MEMRYDANEAKEFYSKYRINNSNERAPEEIEAFRLWRTMKNDFIAAAVVVFVGLISRDTARHMQNRQTYVAGAGLTVRGSWRNRDLNVRRRNRIANINKHTGR